MANDVWTEEQKAYLLAERAKGTPVPVIAATLGKPVPATYTRCRMLGNRVQVHTPWTADLEARLRDLATGGTPMSDQALADAVGKTVPQMRWKLADLGLVGARTKRPKRIPGGLGPAQAARSKGAAAAPRDGGVAARDAARLAGRMKAEADARADRERHAAARAATRDARAIAAKAAATAARVERARQAAQNSACRSRQAAEVAPALVQARSGATKPTPQQPIGLAPVGSGPASAARTSGRGGWVQTHARRGGARPAAAPSRDSTLALSRDAGEAVARFMAERGVTRVATDPVEQVVTYLRRRGYVVVAEIASDETQTQWTVDNRHVLPNAVALKQFAEARGYV